MEVVIKKGFLTLIVLGLLQICCENDFLNCKKNFLKFS